MRSCGSTNQNQTIVRRSGESVKTFDKGQSVRLVVRLQA
jgi:hypothetical protein